MKWVKFGKCKENKLTCSTFYFSTKTVLRENHTSYLYERLRLLHVLFYIKKGNRFHLLHKFCFICSDLFSKFVKCCNSFKNVPFGPIRRNETSTRHAFDLKNLNRRSVPALSYCDSVHYLAAFALQAVGVLLIISVPLVFLIPSNCFFYYVLLFALFCILFSY